MIKYNVYLDGVTLTVCSTVKKQGVMFNQSFDNHISNVCRTAFFHLRQMLSVSDAENTQYVC